MVLPTTTAAIARERLQGMLHACRRMEAAEGEDELPGDLTFSAGIAEAPAHGTTIDALMISADRLLYKAKNDGRARIEAAVDAGRAAFSTSLAAREPID